MDSYLTFSSSTYSLGRNYMIHSFAALPPDPLRSPGGLSIPAPPVHYSFPPHAFFSLLPHPPPPSVPSPHEYMRLLELFLFFSFSRYLNSEHPSAARTARPPLSSFFVFRGAHPRFSLLRQTQSAVMLFVLVFLICSSYFFFCLSL